MPTFTIDGSTNKKPTYPYIRIPAWGLRRGFVADSTESSDADDRRCSREALWQAGKRPWHGGNEDEEKVEFPVGRWEMCNTLTFNTYSNEEFIASKKNISTILITLFIKPEKHTQMLHGAVIFTYLYPKNSENNSKM